MRPSTGFAGCERAVSEVPALLVSEMLSFPKLDSISKLFWFSGK